MVKVLRMVLDLDWLMVEMIFVLSILVQLFFLHTLSMVFVTLWISRALRMKHRVVTTYTYKSPTVTNSHSTLVKTPHTFQEIVSVHFVRKFAHQL